MTPEKSTIQMSDGAELNLLSAGSGPPLLMLPGWSQSAAMFKHQLAELSDSMRVLALDPRGHGDSSNVRDGYTIDQMTTDLREVIESLDLTDVTLLGHSLSNTFFWLYGQQFNYERIKRMVIADQSPVLCTNLEMSPEEQRRAGVVFTPRQLEETCSNFRASAAASDDGAKSRKATQGMIAPMFSPDISESEFEWALQENLKFPRDLAAELLHDGSLRDWRDVIAAIELPTLVIGGRKSVVPWQSQEWIGQQIRGARTVILTEEECGYHFAFLQNPVRFNQEVRSFCKST